MRRRVGRVAPGDAYADLAEAVERGAVAGDGGLDPDGPRERYTLSLGTWESMIADLLGQLAADAGSVERALVKLGVPSPSLIDAWTHSAEFGARESARWMAAALDHNPEPLTLTRDMRARRGDHYLDLATVGTRFSLAGDGSLEPARLRWRYTIERAPWLRMVGDLLAQVVGDAGSVERAATVFAVSQSRLTKWVRWLVSRGSLDAAVSRWPVAPPDDMPTSAAYDDLAEAVERGALAGDNTIGPPQVRDSYTIRLDSWERMTADLLGQIVADAGSIRRASKVIDVPRATLGAWARQLREP